MMEVWGGKVHSSPSQATEFGRSLLAKTGSSGLRRYFNRGEAVEDPHVRYAQTVS